MNSMKEKCPVVQLSTCEDKKDVVALSHYLTAEKKARHIKAYSFLLADNRDMRVNDFARDIKMAFECPDEKLEDVTALVRAGRVY